MKISSNFLLAPITNPNDPDWLTPFMPGFDLQKKDLTDQEQMAIALALHQLLGADQATVSNWKTKSIVESLRKF